MSQQHDRGDDFRLEYREVRATISSRTRLTPLAFDRHVQRGYFPKPRRLEGRSWRWYHQADVDLILDLCRRRHWLKA